MPGGSGAVEVIAEVATALFGDRGQGRVFREAGHCAGRTAVALLLDDVLFPALQRGTLDGFALDAPVEARAHGALFGDVPHVSFVVEAGRVVAFGFTRRQVVVVVGRRDDRVVLDVVVVVLVAGTVVRYLDGLQLCLQDWFVFRFRAEF